ncbi:nitrogen fixation protein NifZ [Paraburkholderia caballeronis]|uniref:nitrogen fixation protein NifZ n=1 Tax=Paraburkholderia caballeronis TaxID=416943 RepID=UPI0010662D2D|nr:nitrogen fixation protein NifZ [Paraburkholderia caballeronis]TDV26868.1 nitrogen fixation protein NifZ [Paraburkholderia caballeronis]
MNFEPVEPAYSWGMRVVALDDLRNDGSYPERGDDECLVTAGALGEIVNVGRVVDSGEPVYLVEFGRHVVGCTGDEIAPAPAGLLPEQEALP